MLRAAAPLGRPRAATPLGSPAPNRRPVHADPFALDQGPRLLASFTLNEVITAIKGHAIGRARLDGTYEIR